MNNSKKIIYNKGRTDLKSALDSKYIALSSHFSPTRKAALLVLVEDTEDIPFWTELFQCVVNRYSDIHITTLKEKRSIGEPEKSDEGNVLYATGKNSLMKVEGLGPHKVVAVDRDYDGLFSNYSLCSVKLQASPYVISTTYYSIENHLAWPGAINKCLQTILQSKVDYLKEYNIVLTQYNNTIKPLVVLLLACVSTRLSAGKSQEYHISDLASDLANLNQTSEPTSMLNCQKEAIRRNSRLLRMYKSEMANIKALLTTSSKFPGALWKVIQGHILYSFVSGYMERIVTRELNRSIRNIHLKYKSDLAKANREEEKYRKLILSTHNSIRERVSNFLYDNPIIDYSDPGIKKIIDKISKL